ncbi:hypothetical protein ACLOJK_000866 [Asimina triloba]
MAPWMYALMVEEDFARPELEKRKIAIVVSEPLLVKKESVHFPQVEGKEKKQKKKAVTKSRFETSKVKVVVIDHSPQKGKAKEQRETPI